MIRPFSLRDWALLRRLGDEGTLLHAESALTRSCQPLRGALFNMVTRGDAATLVWRAKQGEDSGFVQLLLPPGQPYAQLLCLGATPVEEDGEGYQGINEDAWLYLLDGAVAAMGERGVHSVVAEIDELGPELPVLRRAGFAVYTRQDIWATAGPAPAKADRGLLALATELDEWDMEWLYAHTVPPLIQVVEPSPPQEGQLWILRDGEDLAAFVHLHDGPAATWMRLFLHPNAQGLSADILSAATALADPRPEHPVYCCVRRYQSWLQSVLAGSGYALCRSQAVMVRHVAKPRQQKVGELSALLHTQPIHPTTMLEPLSEPRHL